MIYNLIYIDDNPKAHILADGFNTTGKIKVEVIKPTSFEEQIKELSQLKGAFQGLILDLKLDEDLSGDRKAYYTATTLASHIRSKVVEGQWENEVPIFLFTTQDRLNDFFSNNELSHDLFDFCFAKDRITEEYIQHKIYDVIAAYDFIKNNKTNILEILAIDNTEHIDKRIFPSTLTEKSSVHNFSRIILNELVLHPGPLIDEKYLAARLGIDMVKSEDWVKIKDEIFKEAKYSGVYSTAWERWWMYKINNIWESINPDNPLAVLDARDRVEILKNKLELSRIVVAERIPKNSSYRYWTICQGYFKPMDPREGLRIDEPEPKPWLETKYISIEAALERVRRDEGLKINPIERERFEDIKKRIKPNESK